MIYKLRLSANVVKDIQLHKKSGDKKLLLKIKVLFEELRENPRTGTGQPEILKHNLQGLYSRRINRKHRLIYDIKDETVTVILLSAYSHYGDK